VPRNSGITVHRAVFGDDPIADKTILVQGVLGAVGSMAAQLARWGGATVIGTVARTSDLDQVDPAVPHPVAPVGDPQRAAGKVAHHAGGAADERPVFVSVPLDDWRQASVSGQDSKPSTGTQVSAAAAAADRICAGPPSGGDTGSDRVRAMGADWRGDGRYAGELVPA
jgi:NADPH:quinone reductase